jgi:hypothetical protein
MSCKLLHPFFGEERTYHVDIGQSTLSHVFLLGYELVNMRIEQKKKYNNPQSGL